MNFYLKNILILCGLLYTSVGSAQVEWAPVGGVYYYNYSRYFFLTDTHYSVVTAEITGDTLIQGKSCRVFSNNQRDKAPWRCLGQKVYMYNDSGFVYLFNQQVDSFTLLYDFNAQPGESWSVPNYCHESQCLDSFSVVVDSVGFLDVDLWEFQVQHVSVTSHQYSSFDSSTYTRTYLTKIINNVGASGLVGYAYEDPCGAIVDPQFDSASGLRCLYTPDDGVIKFKENIQDCAIFVDNLEVDELDDISIYPNPVDGILTIKSNKNFNVEIYNLAGVRVLVDTKSEQSKAVDLSHLDSGAYFVNIYLQGGRKVAKVMKY